MRHVTLFVVAALLSAITMASAQGTATSNDPLVGSWGGTFDGDGSGRFGMSIARNSSKNLAGSIDVAPEMGDGYTANFTSIDVDGTTVAMAYTTADGATVKMESTLDGTTLKGTWKVFEPGTTNVVASGGFTSARQ